jgi:hypothetical protein
MSTATMEEDTDIQMHMEEEDDDDTFFKAFIDNFNAFAPGGKSMAKIDKPFPPGYDIALAPSEFAMEDAWLNPPHGAIPHVLPVCPSCLSRVPWRATEHLISLLREGKKMKDAIDLIRFLPWSPNRRLVIPSDSEWRADLPLAIPEWLYCCRNHLSRPLQLPHNIMPLPFMPKDRRTVQYEGDKFLTIQPGAITEPNVWTRCSEKIIRVYTSGDLNNA